MTIVSGPTNVNSFRCRRSSYKNTCGFIILTISRKYRKSRKRITVKGLPWVQNTTKTTRTRLIGAVTLDVGLVVRHRRHRMFGEPSLQTRRRGGRHDTPIDTERFREEAEFADGCKVSIDFFDDDGVVFVGRRSIDDVCNIIRRRPRLARQRL